jgi:hypothetical protein
MSLFTQKRLLIPLGISILLLNLIFLINNHSFMAMYYVLWLGGVGHYIWKYGEVVKNKLTAWKIGSFKKFLILGIMMIVCEETFAGISMHAGIANNVGDIFIGISQFLAFNLLALPGFIIGWYVLLARYTYSRQEIFILVGLFGLFAEKTVFHIITNPLMGGLLILPVMYTYALIITPSVLSFRGGTQKSLPKIARYILGLIVPFLVSIPFIGILTFLRTHYPDVFPASGFVS